MKEFSLKEYKKIYTEISVSDGLIEQKWAMLSDLLPDQSKPSFQFIPYGALVVSAFAVLFIIIGVLSYSSKPGTLLYPINNLTQQLSKKMTGAATNEVQYITPIPSFSNTLKQAPTPTLKPTSTIQPTIKEVQNANVKDFNVNKNTPTSTKVLGTQTEYNTTRIPTQIIHGDFVHANNQNNSHAENSNDQRNEKNTESHANSHANEHGNSK